MKKYLYRDEIELYDLHADPDEVVNLAGHPEYADLKLELSRKLLAYLKRTTDPWLLRHDIPGLKQTTGHIGLLGHGSRVEFRNLRVKELKGRKS